MFKKFILSALICVAFFSSNAQRGRVYVTDKFNGIQFSVPVNLTITVGAAYEVKAVGVDDDINWIVVEQDGSNLKIRTKRGNHRFNSSTQILVTMPEVQYISLAGSGNISTKGTIKGTKLSVDLAGSGDVRTESVEVEDFYASIAGSGKVIVTSSSFANKADVKIAGSGNVEVQGLRAKEVQVNIAGSGTAVVFAADNLIAKIAGSGDVVCYGNPKNTEQMKFGSGRIIMK